MSPKHIATMAAFTRQQPPPPVHTDRDRQIIAMRSANPLRARTTQEPADGLDLFAPTAQPSLF